MGKVEGGHRGHNVMAHGGQKRGQGPRPCMTEDARGGWQTYSIRPRNQLVRP